MHRVRLIAGTWFSDADEVQLDPQVIVNEVFWDRMGRPPLASHPVVALGGQSVPGAASGIPAGDTAAVVIGVIPAAPWDT